MVHDQSSKMLEGFQAMGFPGSKIQSWNMLEPAVWGSTTSYQALYSPQLTENVLVAIAMARFRWSQGARFGATFKDHESGTPVIISCDMDTGNLSASYPLVQT